MHSVNLKGLTLTHSLTNLEKNIHTRVINLAEASLKVCLAQAEREELKQVGLLMLISETNNPLTKIFSIFSIYLKLVFLKPYLKYKKYSIQALYGVYPTVTEPIAIYELDSDAANYMQKHVLPAFPGGANGKIRKGILRLTKLHPSLAGVVFIVHGA